MNTVVFWPVAACLDAANTWHLLWMPLVWICFPGVLVAHGAARLFDIPAMRNADKAIESTEVQGIKRWDLVGVNAVLKVAELAVPGQQWHPAFGAVVTTPSVS